jgi:tetratricopeptide (TPR) repeat protein
MTVRRRLIVASMAAVLLVSAVPALAQIRRIQGKVVDGEGQPVAGADIEATIVSLADADFAVRNNDQTWRARTNATGDYIVAVPAAGTYVVTATKEGIGSDRTKVAAQRSGLATANLTLWKPAAVTATVQNCGTGTSIGAVERSGLAAGADRGLARLLGWVEAVHRHTPGCNDAPLIEIGRWPPRDLATLLRDIKELVAFLQRTQDERGEHTGRASVQRDQAILFIYDRRFTLDDLQRRFYGNDPLRANDLLRRGAVFHADIGFFVPGNLNRYPLVEDGGRKGWREGSSHWEVGRALLDGILPSPGADGEALLWYRALSAHFFGAGNLAELATHLNRARHVFPRNADLLFDSAHLHHELSSPAIQASVQQVRASDVSVAVGSRVSELQRAEQFFREGLALAPADADARVRLGHTLGELGRHAEAASELRNAIAARPDRRRLYLAELFLGREEEALGRNAEARRHYEQAGKLYPNAQSPRLALSRLARQTGDRASAQRALLNLVAVSDADASDPWWAFYRPHTEDAGALMERMRKIGMTQ